MAELTLYEKLDQIEHRYVEMAAELSSPEILGDSANYQKLARRHAELSEMVEKYREWKQIDKELAGAKQMALEAEDPEMKQLAQEEEKQLAERKEKVERDLKLLLLPKDPNDEKNVIVEIRAGTGGDEAALFAGELFRMYSRYAESQKWKVEILESSPSSLGGMKQVVASIQGQKVYSKLKYESGVHRVQRSSAYRRKHPAVRQLAGRGLSVRSFSWSTDPKNSRRSASTIHSDPLRISFQILRRASFVDRPRRYPKLASSNTGSKTGSNRLSNACWHTRS